MKTQRVRFETEGPSDETDPTDATPAPLQYVSDEDEDYENLEVCGS